MKDILDADKLLQVAMELELTGETFYEIVASACGRDRPAVEQFFRGLAQEEREHYRKFDKMLRDLSEKAGRPARAMSDEQQSSVIRLLSQRVLPDPAAARDKAARCGFQEAVDISIEMERKAIAFYTGVLPTIAQEQDAEALRQIIDEEKRHEKDLVRLRRSAGG